MRGNRVTSIPSIASTKSKGSSKTTHSCAFCFESLEERRLLAGDSWEAAIDGPGATEIIRDTNGDVIVATYTSGQILLSKFSAIGVPIWDLSLGDAGLQSGRINALEIDADGQVLVAGQYEGTLDFDPGSGEANRTTSGTDGFVASFQDTGSTLSLNWAHLLGDTVRDLAIDDAANIYAVGGFGTALEFDSTPIVANATSFAVGNFVAAVSDEGSLSWARQIEEDGVFLARSIALDSGNSIHVGGSNSTDDSSAINPRYPNVVVDGQLLDHGGNTDGYVLEFRQIGGGAAFNDYYHFGSGPEGESVREIEITSGDDLYILARNVGAGDFPFAGTTVSSTYGTATVIGKVELSSTGALTQWVRVVQSEPLTRTMVSPQELEIVESSSGDVMVYATGFFAGTADFDPGPGEHLRTSRNPPVNTIYDTTPEGFLLALNDQGDFSRAWQFGYQGYDIVAFENEAVHVAGNYFDHSPHMVTSSLPESSGSFVVGINPAQPTVVLDPPEQLNVSESVLVAAVAYDLNNVDIAESIVWTDSFGTVLGTGQTVTLAGLPAGDHSITATATDTEGRTGQFTFDLRVTEEPVAIPDTGTLLATMTIEPRDAVLIEDVNVSLDISHSRNDNLDVFLVAPDGTRVELFTDIGGRYGQNFDGTTFDSDAADSITSFTSPFSGTFRPEGDLSVLNGKNSEGVWTLEVTDDRRRDTGTLNWWTLDIAGSPAEPNEPPEIISQPQTMAIQDEVYTYDVDAADPDANASLDYFLDVAPDGMTIDQSSGVIDWVPNSTQVGSNLVIVRVEDQLGASDLQSFTVEVTDVNDAPMAAADLYDAEKNKPLNVAATGLLANDTDADGDVLTVLQYTQPTNGTVEVSEDGSFNYIPAPDFVGTDGFTYQASDGVLNSNSTTVTIEVAEASTDSVLYVYEIYFDSKRGNKDWRAAFEIRSDSNSNGIGDPVDTTVSGVSITVTFAGIEYSGVTDSNGVFRTPWLRNLSRGSYLASVEALWADGYSWDPLNSLNLEDDSDDDGFPDDVLVR